MAVVFGSNARHFEYCASILPCQFSAVAFLKQLFTLLISDSDKAFQFSSPQNGFTSRL
jgi:hypothetical protein